MQINFSTATLLITIALCTSAFAESKFLAEQEPLNYFCPSFEKTDWQLVSNEIYIQVTPNSKPEYCLAIQILRNKGARAVLRKAKSRMLVNDNLGRSAANSPAGSFSDVEVTLPESDMVELLGSVKKGLNYLNNERMASLKIGQKLSISLDVDELKLSQIEAFAKVVYFSYLPGSDLDLMSSIKLERHLAWIGQLFELVVRQSKMKALARDDQNLR